MDSFSISNSCRLCLQFSDNLKNIFDDHFNCNDSLRNLSTKIMTCVSIKISPTDKGPHKICSKCEECVDSWFEFHEICKVSEAFLQKYHSDLETKFEAKKCASNSNPSTSPIGNENLYLLSEISLLSSNSILGKSPSELSDLSPFLSSRYSPPRKHGDDFVSSQKSSEQNQQTIVSEKKKIRYECELCELNFPRFSELLRHDNMKHVAEGRNFQCHTCERLFVSAHRVAFHEEITHREKTYKCRTCQKMFVSKKSLNVHERLHSEKYKCEICGFLSTSKLYLSQHTLKHEGKNVSFTCKTCKKSFSHKSSLLRHENLHLTNRGMSFRCSTCRLFCRSRNDLEEHLKTHRIYRNSDNQNYYSCAICYRRYNQKKTLIAHLKRHGRGNFKCNVCDRIFFTKYELRVHAETHSDYKSYECFHCNERFSFKNTFVRHIKKYFPRIPSNIEV